VKLDGGDESTVESENDAKEDRVPVRSGLTLDPASFLHVACFQHSRRVTPAPCTGTD